MKLKLDEIILDYILYLKTNSEVPFSLLSGNCGIFLLVFLYFKNYSLDLSKYDVESLFLKSLTETFQNPPMNFTDGISGIGWMLQLLVKEEILEYSEVTKVLDQIDSLSSQFAIHSLRNGNHDFLYGAAGEMLYLQSRMNYNNKVKKSLIAISDSLIDSSKNSVDGIYWQESGFMLEDEQKNKEVSNLGISHGQASKIVILSKLVENGIEVERYSKVLTEAVKFILSCKNKFTQNCFFPSIIENNVGQESAFWWSYGDLGIGIALYQAGRALGNPEIIKEAESIYHYYKNTKIEETGIFEASLCRGTSGVALMYHNMFLNTGIDAFRVTSDYWFDETLKLAKYSHDSDSISGFKFLNNYSTNRDEWFYQSNPGLLMGTAGVGLAMLSKLSGKKMAWSQCLLLN
ncbi:hypothetical protein G3O08_09810 [Cryomorpha ignava]|uniref:Lanthionine synthetase C family protein n=1 Tax=Cryomorpha ignava TaxID=101383 RepID=A0A7K3WQG7_9FLAO|nr:lanthionine synthetase LanC family protein [Cryomorpha ignava]NEN23796.1 hypothetical protein [Cryomorpha ignava]